MKYSKKSTNALRAKFKRLQKIIDNGYVVDNKGRLVHRVLCRKFHGPFPRDWVVHHIDENKKNNSAENLIALPRQLHNKLHDAMRKNKTIFSRKTCEEALGCYIKSVKTDCVVNITINL